MSKYNYKNIWRAIVSILLLLAIIGPWWFDRIYVPAKYPCNLPVVRLEGDFCGVPMSGIWIYAFIGARLIELSQEIGSGKTVIIESISMILQAFLFLVCVLCLLLPLVNPWLLILKRDNKLLHRLQVISLCLAIFIGWYVGFELANTRNSMALWGPWLYIGVAGCALIIEVLMIIMGQKDKKVYV